MKNLIPFWRKKSQPINVETVKALCDDPDFKTPMYAEVIAASKCIQTGAKLATLELFFPRCILAEQNTHRVFSRNTGSSRAIPVLRMLRELLRTPFKPLFWGANKSGMQSAQQLPVWKQWVCSFVWNFHRLFTYLTVRVLTKLGLHKQWSNRLLEPHSYIRQVVTSSDWENYLHLRLHDDAQPEIILLACLVKKALDSAEYRKVDNRNTKANAFNWHLPYISPSERLTFQAYPFYLAKLSAARCARTSYLNQEGMKPNPEKEINTFKLLVGSVPMHCFDGETEVLTSEGFKFWGDVGTQDLLADVCIKTLTFKDFARPLELISGKHTGKMVSLDNALSNFRVTDGHTFITLGSRGVFQLESFKWNTPVENSRFTTSEFKGGLENRIPTQVFTPESISDRKQYQLGCLIGFYLGDGFKIDTTIGFHFKKTRKLDFIVSTLSSLDLEFNLHKNLNGTYNLRVYKSETTDQILKTFGFGCKTKKLPVSEVSLKGFDFLYGLFEGLRNSDGSNKRNTWVYSSVNESLIKGIQDLAPLVGLTVGCVNVKTLTGLARISFNTKNYFKVNDARRVDSYIQEELVENESVFCATMPSGALIVRRKGKVTVMGNSSPLEHQAFPAANVETKSRNLVGFIQYREYYEKKEFGAAIVIPKV